MIELHLLVVEGEREGYRAHQIMVRDDTDNAPQDEPQAGSVVLEVTVVYEQETRLKEDQ